MKTSYKDTLLKAGLSEKEASIYEILLVNGRTAILELIKKTPYKRGDLYNILYSLRDKGLVQQITDQGKLHFQLKNPFYLRDLMDQERQKLIENTSTLEASLPGMLSLFNLAADQPSVRVYEGAEGLQTAYDELNTSGSKEILLMRSIYDNDDPLINQVIEKQIKKQVRLGIHTKAVTPLAEKSLPNYYKRDKERLVERRLVERDMFSLEAQMLIWNNTVALISHKERLICTLIDNPGIAQTMRSIFTYVWKTAEPFHQATLQEWEKQKDAPSKS